MEPLLKSKAAAVSPFGDPMLLRQLHPALDLLLAKDPHYGLLQ